MKYSMLRRPPLDSRSFLILTILILFFPALFAQKKVTIRTVVIDAGHGGQDPGALGSKTREKDITLAVALKLGETIRQNLPGIKVIFTRDKDEFIELHRRSQIANENKADLFISIHCNSTKSSKARGSETYVMGLHRTAANLEVAKKENSSILYEPDYEVRYDGFNPNSDESYITFSLFQNAYLEQSLEFAALVQKEFGEKVGMDDRGVRQAGFLVLYHSTMPSVLIELGFLSNPEQENFLKTEKGQAQMANSICRAFMEFSHNAEVPFPAITEEKPKAGKDTAFLASAAGYPVFKIQIATSGKPIPLSSPVFKGLDEMWQYKHNGVYKYTTGAASSFEEAATLLEEIKGRGFHDAFVVAFLNNERIDTDKAKGMQKPK